MVPAYDHHDLFVGHASMVREISGQLPLGITKPDAILCCVGGGGLLGGIIMGCKEVGWDDGASYRVSFRTSLLIKLFPKFHSWH
jgi:L-serine/L-threonine ammonia-lyase